MPETPTTLSVLAVDDNKLNLILLSQLLKLLGLSSDLAYSGAEAIEKAKFNDYQVIFMDIHMPEIDGFMATQEIRKYNQDVLIFALSADTTKPAIQKGLKSGMNAYLSKPITKDRLVAVLKEYLGDAIISLSA
ncbi:response regulator [Leeuwenhoekiella aequorea]|uniref:CheY-like chemotaxis protein n=1 Tax=Leeuwenhoekiella aequorea TaxID=283736 RepID=A0A4Q0PBZ6_9FLAO|nr:response regulator [Leeuwenhoekiella aequorea]RXG23489.1 CheY-like chemotaxis protein [Leeuwenhoekiella aequorea]